MDENIFEIRLCSGAPWNLVLTTEQIGPDVLCRLHGGTEHIGTAAIAYWDGKRVRSAGKLVAGQHKEGPLASVVAHKVCQATQTTVTCLAGLHYDGISAADIAAITTDAMRLSATAAQLLTDLRIRRALARPECVLQEIKSRALDLKPRVDAFLNRSIDDVLAEASLRGSDKPRPITLFAPLYLSNACPNDCAYCGFRRSAAFTRKHLTIDEAVREAQALADSGFRTIDLVTGEVPADPFVDSMCKVIEAIHETTAITHINLNLGALSLNQFRRLRSAGATGYHLYQETYDPDVYRAVHRHGRKRDMPHRLASSFDVVDAGFDTIGLGVLVGLREPAFDLACMCSHASILKEYRSNLRIGFSLPRIQTVGQSRTYTPGWTVDDDMFIKCMLALRTLDPEAQLTLTSREPQPVRDALLPLGVTKISAGVSTAPGGYTAYHETETSQFSISDERSLDEIENMIRSMGLDPVL